METIWAAYPAFILVFKHYREEGLGQPIPLWLQGRQRTKGHVTTCSEGGCCGCSCKIAWHLLGGGEYGLYECLDRAQLLHLAHSCPPLSFTSLLSGVGGRGKYKSGCPNYVFSQLLPFSWCIFIRFSRCAISLPPSIVLSLRTAQLEQLGSLGCYTSQLHLGLSPLLYFLERPPFSPSLSLVLALHTSFFHALEPQPREMLL